MSRVTRLHRVIRDLQALLTIQSHPRPWHMPLVAALATGLPLFLGEIDLNRRKDNRTARSGIAFNGPRWILWVKKIHQ